MGVHFAQLPGCKLRVGQVAFKQGGSFTGEENGRRMEQGSLRPRSTSLSAIPIIQKEHGKRKVLFCFHKVVHNSFGNKIQLE